MPAGDDHHSIVGPMPAHRNRKPGVAVPPAFDARNPPAKDLIDDCVHCGFCLPTCPTYALFGEEMDSPRGRIYLMKEALQGEPLSPGMVRHFDLCLGCLACETACPSDVHYGTLIEATRQQIERRYRRPLADRLFRSALFAVFPYPERLRLLLPALRLYRRLHVRRLLMRTGLLARLPERFRALESLMPEPGRQTRFPACIEPRGQQRADTVLLLGCVQRIFFPDVNAATARVLAAEGCRVRIPPDQGCCGALSLHAGREEEAQRLARRLIDAFESTEADAIIVNSAGCGSAMKGYGQLLRHDPDYTARAAAFSARVRDISEYLAQLGPAAQRHPLNLSIVYQDACHLAHGQGIRRQPRQLLAQIPGVQIKELPWEREMCCGSAGIYNMVEASAGSRLGERKAKSVVAADAELLVTGNPGCRLQIGASLARAGLSMPMAHPIEVLDASIRGLPTRTFMLNSR